MRVESKQAKIETGECQLNEAFHFFWGCIQERVPNLACTVTCPSSQKPCIIKLIRSSASEDIETPFATLKKKSDVKSHQLDEQTCKQLRSN